MTRGAGLLLTAFALYVVAPSLLALLDAVPSLGDVGPAWFLVVAGAEGGQLACLWALLPGSRSHQGLVHGGWCPSSRGTPRAGCCPADQAAGSVSVRAGCWCGPATQ